MTAALKLIAPPICVLHSAADGDGEGILLQTDWDVHDDLRAGRLVPVLADYRELADVWAASTVRLSHSAKVRVCVQFLQEQLGGEGPFALKREKLPPPGARLGTRNTRGRG